jgi:hypothetical protein
MAASLTWLIIDDGCEGNFFIGNSFQNPGGGGRLYEGRAGTSGHFLLGTEGAGGVSNFTVFVVLIHLPTVCQFPGIPVLTLPTSEWNKQKILIY